jgi:hypothetical protein
MWTVKTGGTDLNQITFAATLNEEFNDWGKKRTPT